ncbi:hypothetical protein HPP92_017897 [Vanilla planifolia]|uniref:RanBP2-type domain-containing protein n=1 Tax=Vanilla planifolia TaxID=51239 RepID=A0A835QEK3_VANPL|nr:hypothetical protein HPP92_017897 [Vanilla planifolia]
MWRDVSEAYEVVFWWSRTELEKAQTIDVMRYLLSYMYKQLYASDGNQFTVDESVETSVRKLFVELYNLSGTVWIDKSAKPSSTEPTSVQEHISRPSGQGFEMKRGDWICPKCTFVNFARNMSCLECGEIRTKRQLTGAEWECPQCDFFNYGRNMSCLRCDCRRPEGVPLGSAPYSGLGHSTSSTMEQMSSPYEQFSIGGSSKRTGSDDSSDSISRSLDRILGRSSRSGTQSPDDMFKKTPEPNSAAQRVSNEGVSPSSSESELIDSLLKSSESYSTSNSSKESSDTSPLWSNVTAELDNAKDVANELSDENFPDIMPMRKGENRFVVSKKKDRSFTSPAYKRRLASEQVNNYNSIPFVPFPPGYFAKKENQPATDSAEKSVTMEAKAEDGEEQKMEMSNRAGSSPAHSEGRINGKNLNQSNVSMNYSPSGYSFQQNASSWENKRMFILLPKGGYSAGSTHQSDSLWNNKDTYNGDFGPVSARPNAVARNNSSYRSSWNSDNLNNRDGGPDFSSNASLDSAQQAKNWQQNDQNGGYSGKSLEGSLVKDPDPLDMSEEAKAERWFRRAAQIKDISELSQIPDEDFPEIMPMRKGVNRFVVSKRKTPLERRLTSPQYRRNLPTVNSELDKDANN